MKFPTPVLYKVNGIAGMLYKTKNKSNAVVIYAIGAPIPPDNGTLPDAQILLSYGIDIFVPDYIGYGRSDGVFTPINCIKTFLILYKLFTNGCYVVNSYSQTKTYIKYKRIIFVGRSFGGTYIPILPRYNKNIKELAIVSAVVDSKSCGSVKGEESNEDFLRSMDVDGYKYLYRGILRPIWRKHLENMDDLSPMDNIRYLKTAHLFIGHGEKDICVHFSKTVGYFKKIIELFPNKKNQFKLKIYKKGDHGPSTTNAGMKDFMKWLGIKKIY